MKPSNRKAWIILLALTAAIKLFSLFPDAVESWYSTGIYPYLSQLQRLLLGWIPFSMGDILYALAGFFLLRGLFLLLRKAWRKEADINYAGRLLRGILFYSLLVYVVFNLFWGLNYNRRGIVYQLNLPVDSVQKKDLPKLLELLAHRLNSLDSQALADRALLARKKYLFSGAVSAYRQLAQSDPRFRYAPASVKPSLFSYLGNYLGYTGYYNPFTGEAQVNTTVPLFIQPYTSCHEIGHQLGYARENEANFAGFLAASHSTDPAFRYSVYFDLYSYGRFYLYFQDSLSLRRIDSLLSPSVKKDYLVLKKFLHQYSNPAGDAIDVLYAQYLRANDQPEGKLTYNQVVLWLLAYYRKVGEKGI